jgi:hypothetical protein
MAAIKSLFILQLIKTQRDVFHKKINLDISSAPSPTQKNPEVPPLQMEIGK